MYEAEGGLKFASETPAAWQSEAAFAEVCTSVSAQTTMGLAQIKGAATQRRLLSHYRIIEDTRTR